MVGHLDLFLILSLASIAPQVIGKIHDLIGGTDSNELFSTEDFPGCAISSQVIEKDGRIPAFADLVLYARILRLRILAVELLVEVGGENDRLALFLREAVLIWQIIDYSRVWKHHLIFVALLVKLENQLLQDTFGPQRE